jgi:type I restriction enzyme R subunit
VDELAHEKLTPLLKVKYRDAIQGAVDDLGGTEQARRTFLGFQRFLYQETAAEAAP